MKEWNSQGGDMRGRNLQGRKKERMSDMKRKEYHNII